MLKEQPLESALTRVASASLRASRRNAGRRSGGSSSYDTEQLEKWLDTELVAMRRCSDQQLEDKAWLYGMLELLQRLEHACERSAGGPRRLLVCVLWPLSTGPAGNSGINQMLTSCLDRTIGAFWLC